MRRLICLPIAAFCILWAFHAHAAPLEELVVTAKRINQSAADLAGHKGVVSGAELGEVRHTHINEVMHRVAGAWISRGNGQEHLTAIRSPVLTGAGACGAFLLAQDGIALRASGFCNVNELFESTSELGDHIEVVKGPGSAFYGSNALHGVINVISRAPGVSESVVSVEGGPHAYRRVRLGKGSESWRADFSGTSDGGYKAASGFDQQKLNIRNHTRLGDVDITTTFAMTNLNQETAGFVQGTDAYRDSTLKRANPNPEAYRDARSLRLYSRMALTTASGNTVIVTPYLRDTDMAFLQHFLPGQPLEENSHSSVGIQSSWYGGSNRYALSFGMDGEITSGDLRETQVSPTAGSAFLVATIPTGTHYDYSVDATVLAAFGQVDITLNDALTLVAGLRAERVGYDYDNRHLDGRSRNDGTNCGFGGCRFNRPADRDDTFTNLSPKLSLIYKSGAGAVYATLANGFRAPQSTELYRLQNAQSVSLIDPESILSLELGYRMSGAVGALDISLYQMEKDNVIFRDSNRVNVDNADTAHRGLEISASGNISNTLTATLAFTFARHEYGKGELVSGADVRGNDVDTAPRTLGSLQLGWTPSDRSKLELELTHLGRYYTDPVNLNRYPGHNLVNLRASHTVSRWRVFARVMNLTDRDYAERADLGFGNERYFVGEPRSVYLGAELKF